MAHRRLQATRHLNRLLTKHYLAASHFHPMRPIAYVSSGAPVEILRAMGFLPIYPENYTALCGARKASLSLCQTAEAQGYSPDLCSYARTHLGAIADPSAAPMGGLPRPDLILCCNNICGTILKWFQTVSRLYDVPLFVLDTPYVKGKLKEETINYVTTQLEKLIQALEQNFRRRYREARLRKVIALSNEATALWRDIRYLCTARPSPLNAPDLFVNMAPMVVLRGTAAAVRYYRALKAEVEERVAQGIGAVPVERYRLLWDNIAIWHKLFRFHRHFERYDACFVVDTYTGAWSGLVGCDDPIRGLACTYTPILLNIGFAQRAEKMIDLIEAFEIDGFVMHANRSCKPYSLGQYAIQRLVSERTGVPGLIVEADMCDPRAYSEAQLKTRIQAFMESLSMRDSPYGGSRHS